ncbi:MAG: hypothetical protein A2528_01585 [Candidatus Staskawiczbacteria bacterium RIFOXYD2_FULL_37_9]|uniref:Uncharacterized protein n=1 Tax=Candidatus Staskawiczbacteria bacterium RIFOXYB1_FULL_37_44 TaxID=1802223 RepID=A0A1G2IVP0_9BACT|nr:MAG: hypothetical protein A2358_01930 [Candidatus Staskawiczbacteria bacterium RIFOXYB1_FULL_37_44]OGZ88913.1 MAG: hypothetical protein A2444_04220 [Candidatus Staskawiczbacteria bacterium RIFOXYC2_FULL_37_19]OGZ89862.1 MAG: hypothetical protein A2581_03455 [Candidatus Staskawiczbacteria bacterium RIFOXYD1_FULL_37_110]OGZ92955.1 MAG: hypothetical protein A2528_01585 [Candidatus Staskawiczbacteria bacterium RIFOXYD2_FULL_37_9]
MFDKKELNQIKELLKESLKPIATKKDLRRERDSLAVMMKNSFDVTPTREEMNAGFKTVNEKLDKKVDGLDKRMTRIEDALVVK